MSITTRLMILMVLLVTVIVTLLSAIHLESLVNEWTKGVMERSELVAQQMKSLVVQRIQERADKAIPAPPTLVDMKLLWMRIVTEDPQLESLIRDTVTHAKMIVEVSLAGEAGEILVSSNPAKRHGVLRRLPKFGDWRKKDLTQRLLELGQGTQDYEVTLPLGVPQQRLPIFTIQVVVSSGLLRETLLPQIRTLAWASLASLLSSIILGILSANVAIGPLISISRDIDRIASGRTPADEEKDPLGKTRELAIVQSKLSLLGQQIRGAQEDVTQMRSNIESLVERMENAVLLFDRQDKLILAGPAAERLLERPLSDMMGKKREQLFPPAEPLGEIIQQSVQMKKPVHDYLVTLNRGGDSKADAKLLISVEPLADRSGTMITIRDAESRVQLASQIDMARRLSAISRLTGGVAHEIKNPLNSIALRLELLRGKVTEAGPEAEEEMNIISQEIRRLDRVVKTFLDFTRPVDVSLVGVDLAEVVREVTALVRPQATLQKVNIVFSAEPESIVVQGDRDLLKQAVLNVVMNGIEATKNGGELNVKVSVQEGKCMLSVQDQGQGIPDVDQSRVFQLYFTTKEKGSGIGLAMTYRAVQLHNGTIDFTSETGKGTVFRLCFPMPSET
ncbi:MAG: hypothetical protein HYZ37_09640 [Candidatus Solibacter usitatus]|nr:hypothetical protein [Candidatus Solibacter usitatus]